MKRPFHPPITSPAPFHIPAADHEVRRITHEQFRVLYGGGAPKPKRPHKYGVAPVEQRTVGGIVFSSAAEAKRYGELKLLERGGFIRKLELQPEFVFELNGKPMFRYLADFRYFEGATRITEDVKGIQTPVFRLKRKIVEEAFGVKITLVP